MSLGETFYIFVSVMPGIYSTKLFIDILKITFFETILGYIVVPYLFEKYGVFFLLSSI